MNFTLEFLELSCSWSQCVILLSHCWILLPNVLFRNFASVLISEIMVSFFWWGRVVTVSGFGVKSSAGSWNVLGSFPFHSLWNNLNNTGITVLRLAEISYEITWSWCFLNDRPLITFPIWSIVIGVFGFATCSQIHLYFARKLSNSFLKLSTCPRVSNLWL